MFVRLRLSFHSRLNETLCAHVGALKHCPVKGQTQLSYREESEKGAFTL